MYPQSELYEEATFIAYYLHWSADEIMALPHRDRRRFCEEVSRMHKGMMGQSKNPFDI